MVVVVAVVVVFFFGGLVVWWCACSQLLAALVILLVGPTSLPECTDSFFSSRFDLGRSTEVEKSPNSPKLMNHQLVGGLTSFKDMFYQQGKLSALHPNH